MNRQWVRLIAGLVIIAALVTIAGLVLLATSSSRFAPNSYTASKQNVGAPGSSNVDPDAKGSLAAPGPTPVPGTGGTATTSGSGFANGAGQLLSVPPRLPHSGEQGIENEHEVDPVTPIDLNPVIKTTAPTAPEVNPPKQASTLTGARSADGPNTPDAAFYFFKTTDLGGGASLIGEASQASDGLLALETWNWGAALSHDGGKSWGYLNPYTLFPASYGGFCCDQVVYYDQTHDITFSADFAATKWSITIKLTTSLFGSSSTRPM